MDHSWHTIFFFFFLLDCSFSIYYLLELSFPCSILQPAQASVPHNRRFWPHAMQTHTCMLSPSYIHAEYEPRDTDTAGRGQMWQSRAVLPSEHDLGRQGGAVTHSTTTRGQPVSVAKVSSHQLMTRTGLRPDVRCQAASHAPTLPRKSITIWGFPLHCCGLHPSVLLLQKRQINIWPRLWDPRICSD